MLHEQKMLRVLEAWREELLAGEVPVGMAEYGVWFDRVRALDLAIRAVADAGRDMYLARPVARYGGLPEGVPQIWCGAGNL